MPTKQRKPTRVAPRKKKSKAETDGDLPFRKVWSGSIAFGLVQIPITLIPAERSNELRFHQLDRRDMSRIGYDRINKTTGKKVPWEEIVKGYEISKGEYVVMEDKDFENANVEASRTVEIQDFVPVADIDPMMFERPYYVLPDARGRRAYAVLRESLQKTHVAAVALVVIRVRQHLCAIMPKGDGLILEVLRFNHELVAAGDIQKSLPTASQASARERELAERLIRDMTSEWDPTKYRDTFRDDILAAIEQKAKTGKVTAPARKAAPKGVNVVDLVALLQKSVANVNAQKPKRSPAKATRRSHRSAA